MSDPEEMASQYAEREARAPRQVKRQLTTLREQASTGKWTFEVGYTEAMNYKIEQIAGLVPPEDWQEQAVAQNARAELMMPAAPAAIGGCVATAAAFNWADQGCVTPVKNQKACGSCWAFATHGAFEGSYAAVNGHALIDTSEQQTLDCSGAGSCSGGWWAFQYLVDHGSAKESDYPYVATKGTCQNVASPYGADVWGYVDPSAQIPSVDALKKALCAHGPLAVAVAVTPAFQAYTSGVFNENSSANVNHGITLIGWDDAKKAWRIKNSWGTAWGEGGYMWIGYGCNKVGYGAAWTTAKAALPPCKDAPSEMAQTQFLYVDKKQYSANANIASVTFTLPQQMYVIVTGESSVALADGAGPTTFRTGVYAGESANVMWTASYRRGTIVAANQYVPVHTSMALKLAAGTHTMYWKLWVSGATVQLDSGTLTAVAVPCAMGGQVQATLQADAAGGQQVLEEEGQLTITNPGDPALGVTVDSLGGS